MTKTVVADQKWIGVFLQGFILGTFGLSLFYYLLLFVVTQDLTHPLSQFQLLQPWMSLLIIGFGFQMGLFWLLRNGFHYSLEDKQDARFTAGTGAGVSGMAMVACCAHHAVEVLPILGLSAAALFLSDYQQELMAFGVMANLLGIVMMLWMLAGRPSFPKIIEVISIKVKGTR
jgi:hypothetical protein